MTSSWCVVVISVERFIAVWFYTKAKWICSRRNMAIGLFFVYTTLAIFNGYWSSFADNLVQGMCVLNTKPPGMEKMATAFIMTGFSIQSTIPSSSMVILDCLIIWKLNSLAMKRRKNQVGQAPENVSEIKTKEHEDRSRLTFMLLGVSLTVIILITPISTAHMYFFIIRKNIFEVRSSGMVIFREVAMVMEQANYSIHFFLYVLCSKGFRSKVLVTLRMNKWMNKNSSVRANPTFGMPSHQETLNRGKSYALT